MKVEIFCVEGDAVHALFQTAMLGDVDSVMSITCSIDHVRTNGCEKFVFKVA